MGPGAPMGPGRTPSGKNSKLLIIIGAAVLALIILGVGAGVLINNRSNGATSQPADPADPADPSDPQASAPPMASKPSDAVKAYLEALAAGKAETALALGDEQPADKTFLTDAVLADSNSRGAITDINVPEVTDEYAYSVDASYKIGGQAVSDKYSVKKVGDSWKVRDSVAELNLTSTRSKTLPMLINKVPVKTDKIRIFPGSYAFTSGNKYVDYGKENILVLESPSDYPSSSEIEPTLTAAGTSAFEAAVRAKVKTCLTPGDLTPTGCPNGVREASYQKVDKSSIKWKLDGDPTTTMKPRLDYENPAVVKASGSISFKFSAKGTSFDRRADFSSTVTRFVTMSANLNQTPVKATFDN
jgi:hypothetical protein